MTLKEKLETIIEANGEASEYMEIMLALLIEDELSKTGVDSNNPNHKGWEIDVIEELLFVEKWMYHESSYTYTLQHCIGELVLNKGISALKQLTWLKWDDTEKM